MKTKIAYTIGFGWALIVVGFVFGRTAPTEAECCARADSLAAELRWIAVCDSVRDARLQREYDLILGARPN